MRRIADALEVAPEWLETGHPTSHYIGAFSRTAMFEDEAQGDIDLLARHSGQNVRLTVETLSGRR